MKKSTKIILISLVAVVLLTLVSLGVATVYVILNPPKNLSSRAARASVEGIYGAVRSGVSLYRANTLLEEGSGKGRYPTSLDDQADGPCRSCFANIFDQPISDERWTKEGNRYLFQREDIEATMAYDPASGQVTLSWNQ